MHRSKSPSRTSCGPVMPAVAARQEHIQELFDGSRTEQDGVLLPQMDAYQKLVERGRVLNPDQLKHHHQREWSYKKKTRAEIHLRGKTSRTKKQEPAKPVLVVEEDDPTEACTEYLGDSVNFLGDSANLSLHDSSHSLSKSAVIVEPSQQAEEQKQQREKEVHEAAESLARAKKKKAAARKTMHTELMNNLDFCVKLQEEDEARREAKYGPEIEEFTELPLDERQSKRQVRLQQAKERIRLQNEEHERRQLAKEMTPSIQRAHDWYIQHGMPSKKRMQQRIQAGGDDVRGLTLQDVESLPWMPGAFIVDAAAMAKLVEQAKQQQQEGL